MGKHRSLHAAIEAVVDGTKAGRLRALLPEIEQRLSAGARIADVAKALSEHGLPLSVATLKSYLYRSRKAARNVLSEAARPDAMPLPILGNSPSANAPHREVFDPILNSGTTSGLLRHINTVRCLRLLKKGDLLSRADMARRLDLTRATIGNTVKELLEKGLVLETIDRSSAGRSGRPGAGLALNPQGAYSVGIDISSHALTAVLVDLSMGVVQKISIPVGPDLREVGRAVEEIALIPWRLLAASGLSPQRILGVCVSIPGLVDQQGRVVVAPFLHWRDVPLQATLSAHPHLPWPVTICNDANAFANAELCSLQERDAQNMVLILLTEGLGGAIVQRGQIFAGSHGYAGELGHLVMGASLSASDDQSFERLAGHERFSAFLPSDCSLEDGLMALADEDAYSSPSLERVLDQWAEVLATGLANLVYLLNPEKIVFGGPLSVLFPRITSRVESLLTQHLLHGFNVPLLEVTRLGADGAAIGAASVIRERIFSLARIESP
ncbi:ROK family transcriptional regulator [Pseudomonas sp. RC10]|uniref:ROK family transcriptional regulator n=1 Tax=Pseudomonas bambusae TaxID=3139142 RepID=UPI003138C4BA